MSLKESDKFRTEWNRLNELLLEHANRDIKRFFNLDSQVYRDNVLPAETKELLGLTASLVLRCDDCIRYHLQQCHDLKMSTEAILEVFSISLVVGGSITIPHIRRAFDFWLQMIDPD